MVVQLGRRDWHYLLSIISTCRQITAGAERCLPAAGQGGLADITPFLIPLYHPSLSVDLEFGAGLGVLGWGQYPYRPLPPPTHCSPKISRALQISCLSCKLH